jgi:hypothetical protein
VAAKSGFADHLACDEREIDALIAEADPRGLTPVTTEKDYVRLAAAHRNAILALPVILRFETPKQIAASLSQTLAARWARCPPPPFSARSPPCGRASCEAASWRGAAYGLRPSH